MTSGHQENHAGDFPGGCINVNDDICLQRVQAGLVFKFSGCLRSDKFIWLGYISFPLSSGISIKTEPF